MIKTNKTKGYNCNLNFIIIEEKVNLNLEFKRRIISGQSKLKYNNKVET